VKVKVPGTASFETAGAVWTEAEIRIGFGFEGGVPPVQMMFRIWPARETAR
jgi:hypothetical protein